MSLNTNAELALQLSALHSRLSKNLDRSLMIHGISLTEFLVLLHLSQAPEQTLRRIDLAEKTGLSASGVTRLLNPMQKIGLVTKQAGARDARVSLVTTTAAGARIYREAAKTFEQCADSFLAVLNKKQRHSMTELLTALG